MDVAVIGSPANDGTAALVEHWRALGIDTELVGAEGVAALRPPTIAVVRLDVVPSLDGVESGLVAVLLAERRGLEVRNRVAAMLAAHDKRRTAEVLSRSGVPHPRTLHLAPGDDCPLEPPVVLKPRFGSWGTDVQRCATRAEIRAYLERARSKPWYLRHGALAQQEVASGGRDLRVLVAAGRVIGAVERHAAPGEWRTNVSCGGTARPATVSPAAAELAATAAAVTDLDLVGVDLLPSGGDRYVVIELNGAVDFDADYSAPGRDVYADAAAALLPQSFRVAA